MHAHRSSASDPEPVQHHSIVTAAYPEELMEVDDQQKKNKNNEHQAEEEGTKKKKKKGKDVHKTLPFSKLLSYADTLDWTLMALGTLGAVVHGLAIPIGYLLLGKALEAFGNNIHDQKAMVKSLLKVCLTI